MMHSLLMSKSMMDKQENKQTNTETFLKGAMLSQEEHQKGLL
jgi:hypothetical protein